MTSQTRDVYPQTTSGESASGSGTSGPQADSLPNYFGLNYAQQAALLWANAAAIAAVASANPQTPEVPTTTSTSPSGSRLPNASSSKEKMDTNFKQSTKQRGGSVFKSRRTEKMISPSTSLTGASDTIPDPSAMMMANLLANQAAEGRPKEALSTHIGRQLPEIPPFDQSADRTSNPQLPDILRQMEDFGDLSNGAILANHLLQSLSGAQLPYRQQMKQRHQQQQQQQAAFTLSAALTNESGFPGFPPLFPDNSYSGTQRTEGSSSAGEATNIAYAQAMMMAMAAACGSMKGNHSPTTSTSAVSHGNRNMDIHSFETPTTSQSTSLPSGNPSQTVEPPESFNDVLNLLSHCLKNPRSINDRASFSQQSLPNFPSDYPNQQTSSTSHHQQQRVSQRNGSTSRTRVPNHPTPPNSWDTPPIAQSPPKHRGRGRPPKSLQAALNAQHKRATQNTTASVSSTCRQDMELYPPPGLEAMTSSQPLRRPTSATSLNDGSVDETIEDVLREMAAFDHDPILLANRYAPAALGIMVKRKRRKEVTTAQLGQTSYVSSTLDSAVGPGDTSEILLSPGGKRLRTGLPAESGLRLPLALGWQRETLVKGIGPGGILGDVTYVSPRGRRLWNFENVREYLKANNINMLSVEDFSFKSYIRLGDYYECSRNGLASENYVKMSEEALDALNSSGLTSEMENSKTGTGNWQASNQFGAESRLSLFEPLSHSNASTLPNNYNNSLNYPTVEPPIAHTNTNTPRSNSFDLPTNRLNFYDPLVVSNHNGDSIIRPPPAAHTSNEPSTKSAFQLSLMDPFYPGMGSMPFPFPIPFSTSGPTGGVTAIDNPWSQLNRPIGMLSAPGLMPSSFGGCIESVVERDCMKNFFIQMAKEQLRLDEETQAQRQNALLEEREHFVAVQIKERIEHELKKPVDDLQLLNSKALPCLSRVSGKRLSGRAFTDCLVVVEFLHAFTEILCIDAETIPTLGMLQTALVDRDPECQQALLHLVIELLKFAILDPGLPSSRLVTQLLGQRFSELEVNHDTVTGLLRVFLIGRNGFEDHMSDWLKPPCHFSDLVGDQQIALLAFVCDELVSSSRLISTEVDRTIELQILLKREKWVLDSKIRRLRFIQNRKFEMINIATGNFPTDSGGLSKSTHNETPIPRDVSLDLQCTDDAHHDEGSQSPGPSLDEHHSDGTQHDRRKPDTPLKSNNKILFSCGESGETNDSGEKQGTNHLECAALSTSSATVSTAVASNILLSNDEEDIGDLNQIDSRIESLTQLAEYKQMAIQECAYRLAGLFLGEDRFYRRYYNLGHLGGIFIEGSSSSNGLDEVDQQCDVDEKFERFDPDQLVAQIRARRELANDRRYVIHIPGPHGHQNTQSNTALQAQPQTLNEFSQQVQSVTDIQTEDTLYAKCNPPNGETSTCVSDKESSIAHLKEAPVGWETIKSNSEISESMEIDGNNQSRMYNDAKTKTKDQILTKTTPEIPYVPSVLPTEEPSGQIILVDHPTNTQTEEPHSIIAKSECEVPTADLPYVKDQEDEKSIEEKDFITSPIHRSNTDAKFLPESGLQKKDPPSTKQEESYVPKTANIEGNSVNNSEQSIPSESELKNEEIVVQTSKPYDVSSDSLQSEIPQSHLDNEQIVPLGLFESKETTDKWTESNGYIQPLDLSVKCSDNTTSSVAASPVSHKTFDGSEVMQRLGLNDMVLTTATLLFMTQTSIIPASVACSVHFSEPWRTVIAHYKSLLLWALSEELNSDNPTPNHLDDSGKHKFENGIPRTLREAILILKQTFLTENTYADMDVEKPTDENSTMSEDKLQTLVEKELQTRGIQQAIAKHATVSRPTEWFCIDSVPIVQNLTHALSARGLRERSLAKSIKRAEQVLAPSLRVAAHAVSQLSDTSEGGACEPRFLCVRSRRGKGRGTTASGNNQSQSGYYYSSSSGLYTEDQDLSADIDPSQPVSPAECSTDGTQLGLTEAVILEHRLRRRNTQPSLSANSVRADPIPRMETAERLDKKSGSCRATELKPGSQSLTDLVGSSDPTFLAECQFLKQVEALEDRVLNASLQVKGWQAPVKAAEDEMIHLIPRHTPKRSRFEYWPLDLARSRLINLELHLERRYLLPPLSCEFHLDVIQDADQMSATDGSRCPSEFVDAETGSESGFGCGPGSESTTTSLRDGECGTSSSHPQIRRIIVSKQSAGNDITNVANSPTVMDNLDISCYTFPANEQISPGLLDWRQKLQKASDLNLMRRSMDQLIDAIAWDKSIMKVLCQICRRDNNEAQLLLCDGCDHGYHTYCFRPPLIDIPLGDWFCYDCVTKATGKQLCFICGSGGVVTHKSSSELSSRLLSCEQCSRAVHPTCPRPPITRPPRKWICAKCTAHGTSVGSTNCVQDSNNEVSSCALDPISCSKTLKNSDNSSSVPSDQFDSNRLKKIKAPKKPDLTSTATRKSASQTNHTVRGASRHSFLNRLKQQQQRRNRNPILKSKRKVQIGRAAGTSKTQCNRALFPSLKDHNPGSTVSGGRAVEDKFEYSFEDDTPRKSLSPNEVKWCRMVTKDLIKHDASWAFRKPVNVKQIPIYRQIIKCPMDLSTIYKKTRHPCSYSIINEWYKDVCLIFDNCETFNEDDSEVGRAGHIMRAYFDSRWKTRMCGQTKPRSISPADAYEQDEYSSHTSLTSITESVLISSAVSPPPVLSPTAQVDAKQLEICSKVVTQLSGPNSPNISAVPVIEHRSSNPQSRASTPSSHSSGFSGFEQNEFMIDVPLDQFPTPPPPPSSSSTISTVTVNSTPLFTTHPPTTSIVRPLLPSDGCLPISSTSLKN